MKERPLPEPPPGLNVRQQRFTELVYSEGNATQAYIKAGYKARGNAAEVSASQLLRNPKVQAYLKLLRAPEQLSSLKKKDDLLRYLGDVIFTPISEVGPDSPLCTEYTEDVVGGGNQGKLKRGKASSGNEKSSPTVLRRKVKKADPLRAAAEYSKLLGYYEPDRTEIEVGPKTLLSIKERAAQVASGLVRGGGE